MMFLGCVTFLCFVFSMLYFRYFYLFIASPSSCFPSFLPEKFDPPKGKFQVINGGYTNLLEEETHDIAEKLKVVKMIPHPKYNPVEGNMHDLFLVKVDGDLTANGGVIADIDTKPVEQRLGDVLDVSGYGKLKGGENENSVNTLMATTVTIDKNQDNCKTFPSYLKAPESMICIADGEGDTCQGDSGGPLVIKEGGKPVLVGVVSFGAGCGDSVPDVVAKVSHAQKWIKETMDKYK